MFTCGKNIIIDECMSAHLVRELKWDTEGHPNLTKIQRKPKGVGTEIKTAADGESGVLQVIDFNKGKVFNKFKKFADTHAHHVALVLRISEIWFGTGRTINGDAAFGSVACVTALLKYGLYSKFICKMAHKCFPVQAIEAWSLTNPARGDWAVWSTNVDINGSEKEIIAIAWQSKKLKKFVGSSGTTLPGPPHNLSRSKIVTDENGIASTFKYIRSEEQCEFVNELFGVFGLIDGHDHKRQGILKIEVEWVTHTWWVRILSTFYGMNVIDAFLLMKMEFREFFPEDDEKSMDDLITWSDKLAYQLIFYEELFETRESRNSNFNSPIGSSSSSALTASSAKRSAGSSAHVLQALRYTPYYRKELEKKAAYSRPAEARRRCHVCGGLTSAFCYDCSVRPESDVDPEFCAICSSMGESRGECYRRHIDIVAAADEMRL